MLFLALLFICAGQLDSLKCTSPSWSQVCTLKRVSYRYVRMYSSQPDEEMVDLDKLSRVELQSLAKEYGLKATGKTTDLIEQLSLAIASIRADANLLLPSEEQTLKVSPLERTVTLDSSAGASANRLAEQ